MGRHVVFAVGSRANWGSCAAVVRACSGMDVTVLCYATATLPRYGDVASAIEAEGHRVLRVSSHIEGGRPGDMMRTAALTLSAVGCELERLRADVVYVVGDRYEVLPVAYAAHLLGIPVAHQMGGEVSGTIDESVRHAITKLAHVHFPATRQAARRIEQMGEGHWEAVGCPRLDEAAKAEPMPGEYVLVQFHPVVTESEQAGYQMQGVLNGVASSWSGTVHLWWPNADAGCEAIVQTIRNRRLAYLTHRSLPPAEYYRLLRGCRAIVGNSSSSLREGSFLGTPAVNVGSRQQHRERGANVVDCQPTAAEVDAALRYQLRKGRYEPSELYGDGKSGPRIARLLGGQLPRVQKEWS